ncbi:PREDICTED: shikimate O-hydroxycinnamoyltransferase-like [Nelumbo nucifera]|uniref:Omega-hydroxypalmitate O-feruloyl transferase-like n=2 Tax=Nelumbo nucifera TaxID=4432 RepID=A0A822Z6Q2_NELNU|nr:PREDICTED: shikimate O-hydroxycinnamoyltransferase-like [Nelumbo nucifera]DAD40517.1 TPA_asm: hypothetical protein HUJ06_014840 [Nelumbo nucifera]
MENHFRDLTPLIPDLKVTIQRSFTVSPTEKTERRFMFLSNIDQGLNFRSEGLQFFKPNANYPPNTVIDILETACQKILVPYDFLAGRLRLNPHQDRLEIDCNSAGVGFVVATSDVSVAEIGDLLYPSPVFKQLIAEALDTLGADDQPLCVLQVTSFKCGGFALGVSCNHALFDGISFRIFIENLSCVAAGKPLAVNPYNNRQLLAARSPPRVTFSHPERVKLEITRNVEPSITKTLFEPMPENLVPKIFRLSADDISKLKQKAKHEGSNPHVTTSFNVVAAHIWRCKALSEDVGENDLDQMSTVLYAVDIRPRIRPPLPPSYTGNAILPGYATASFRDIKEAPFSRLVEMVSVGARRMTDEYARSVIDWIELYKGIPYGDLLIVSWWRLRFSEVEYPWGRPSYSFPAVKYRKGLILLIPDIECEGASSSSDQELSVFLSLPIKKMEKFQALFREFLSPDTSRSRL